MCFPWAIAGSVALRAAAETGYETAFADRLFGTRAVRAGDPPYRLMRLKHEYILCLAGRAAQIVLHRAARSMRSMNHTGPVRTNEPARFVC